MKIHQLLNNNVVIALNNDGDEVVVMGTGLGFKAKVGDEIPEDKIQKIFVLKEYGSKLNELIETIPIIYLEITEAIVEYAKTYAELDLNKQIYLALTDHIYFAVDRQKEGILLDNPFLYEVKQYFQLEHKVGLYAKELIKEKIGIDVTENEVGYIAMHIIEAEGQQSKKEVMGLLELVDDLVDLVEKEYDLKPAKDSLQYNRLLIHIKFLAQRYILNEEFDQEDNIIDDMMKNAFAKEYRCTQKISDFIQTKYGRGITNLERNYLVFHLRNCINKTSS